MPVFQHIAGRLNAHFSADAIGGLSIDPFLSDLRLADIAAEAGIVDEPGSISHAILDAIPEGMQASIRALIVQNLSRAEGERWEMTFAWAPGYDFELNIWEAPSTVVSRAGITVLLRTRYPADPHPSTLPLPGDGRGSS